MSLWKGVDSVSQSWTQLYTSLVSSSHPHLIGQLFGGNLFVAIATPLQTCVSEQVTSPGILSKLSRWPRYRGVLRAEKSLITHWFMNQPNTTLGLPGAAVAAASSQNVQGWQNCQLFYILIFSKILSEVTLCTFLIISWKFHPDWFQPHWSLYADNHRICLPLGTLTGAFGSDYTLVNEIYLLDLITTAPCRNTQCLDIRQQPLLRSQFYGYRRFDRSKNETPLKPIIKTVPRKRRPTKITNQYLPPATAAAPVGLGSLPKGGTRFIAQLLIDLAVRGVDRWIFILNLAANWEVRSMVKVFIHKPIPCAFKISRLFNPMIFIHWLTNSEKESILDPALVWREYEQSSPGLNTA